MKRRSLAHLWRLHTPYPHPLAVTPTQPPSELISTKSFILYFEEHHAPVGDFGRFHNRLQYLADQMRTQSPKIPDMPPRARRHLHQQLGTVANEAVRFIGVRDYTIEMLKAHGLYPVVGEGTHHYTGTDTLDAGRHRPYSPDWLPITYAPAFSNHHSGIGLAYLPPDWSFETYEFTGTASRRYRNVSQRHYTIFNASKTPVLVSLITRKNGHCRLEFIRTLASLPPDKELRPLKDELEKYRLRGIRPHEIANAKDMVLTPRRLSLGLGALAHLEEDPVFGKQLHTTINDPDSTAYLRDVADRAGAIILQSELNGQCIGTALEALRMSPLFEPRNVTNGDSRVKSVADTRTLE